MSKTLQNLHKKTDVTLALPPPPPTKKRYTTIKNMKKLTFLNKSLYFFWQIKKFYVIFFTNSIQQVSIQKKEIII